MQHSARPSTKARCAPARAASAATAYADGVIYCRARTGRRRSRTTRGRARFTPLWQGPSEAFGPPIVSAGLVWTLATRRLQGGGGTTLYGLEPRHGHAATR